MEAKWKAFYQCKYFGEESYMFISISEIGHWLGVICVWLDWIDHWSFILDYGLIHTWYSHTTHKSNVQWISISFLWLYVFKWDVRMLNCLLIKFKKIFEYFIWFWKWFLLIVFWKFFSKCQNFCVEKLGVWPFRDSFCGWIQVARIFEEISVSSQIQAESFTIHSRVLHNLDLTHKNLPCAFAHFASNSRVARESLTREMREMIVFKRLEMSVFKKLVFLLLVIPSPQNTIFFLQNSTTLTKVISNLFHVSNP